MHSNMLELLQLLQRVSYICIFMVLIYRLGVISRAVIYTVWFRRTL